MIQVKPKFYRIVIVRPGQLRAPLFEHVAPWDKVGPRVKRGMEQTRSEIDNGAGHCVGCGQRLLKHDDNTVFLIELGYDEDVRWLDVGGGACCEHLLSAVR